MFLKHHRPGAALRRAPALLCVLAIAACSDRVPTGGPPPVPEDAAATLRLECRVDVRAGTLACGQPGGAGAARGALIVGGQGSYLRLASSGTAYDGALGILRSDVTVQNLLAQAMGTTTGADTAGVRVFFAQLPDVTAGTGTAEVANPDGVATFTSGAQPYFHYGEILAPQGTSQPRRWEFAVSPTVESFVFTLLVSTALHDEDAPLRWTRELPGSRNQGSAWDAWSVGSVTFAVGAEGMILRRDSVSGWTRMPANVGDNLRGVWAASRADAIAVGLGGMALRFDGNRWTRMQTGTTRPLQGVWGRSADDVFAVGDAGTVLRWNGAAWTPMTSNTRAALTGVWGTASETFAVGTRVDTVAPGQTRQRGVLLRHDGAAWSETVVDPNDEFRLTRVAGSSATNIVAVGAWRAVPSQPWRGAVLRWDGEGWTRVAQHDTTLVDVWVGTNGEVLAVGEDGAVLRDAGDGWEVIPSAGVGGGTVFRATDGALWVGVAGTLARRQGEAWILENEGNGFPDFEDAWADGAGGIYVVGGHQLARWNGTEWLGQPMGVAGENQWNGVWGRGPGEIYVVGGFTAGGGTPDPDPAMSVWNGAAWTTTVAEQLAGTAQEQLWGVHGSADGATYAVGQRRATSTALSDGVLRRRQGDAWPVVATVPGGELWGVWASSATSGWAVGRWRTPGNLVGEAIAVPLGVASPTPVELDEPGAAAYGVWGFSPTDVYAVGYRFNAAQGRAMGAVWHYDGESWSLAHEAGSLEVLLAVHGSSPTDVYAVGSGGAVIHFNGTAWQPVSTGTASRLFGVHALSRGNVLAVGRGGEILRGRR